MAFKIHLNNKNFYIEKPSQNAILSVIISNKDNGETTFNVGGYVPETSTHISWINDNLEIGASIKIDMSENDKELAPSKPILERKDLTNDFLLKEKLKYFFTLKQELEEAGLI
tara:strand:- start:867 stop:1205 length:339 start_codon:yes stop_codon:yes gene_type:complete